MKYRAIAYNGQVIEGEEIVWRGMTMYLAGGDDTSHWETAVDPDSVQEIQSCQPLSEASC